MALNHILHILSKVSEGFYFSRVFAKLLPGEFKELEMFLQNEQISHPRLTPNIIDEYSFSFHQEYCRSAGTSPVFLQKGQMFHPHPKSLLNVHILFIRSWLL